MESLVSCEWLAQEMGASDLRIIDASWHLPDTERDAAAEYNTRHIPGAIFLNLGDLVDSTSAIDNTLPSPEKFASRMQNLGIGDGSRVVIYDDSAIKSSARAWFMFRLFGACNVAILDGGFEKWQAEGRPVESGIHTLRHRHYTTWSNPKKLRSKADILANIQSRSEQVVDVRGAPRFTGAQAETRTGLASGHIPGSINLPYSSLFKPDGTWQETVNLQKLFEAANLDLKTPIVTTCGSGMTACALAFALHRIGKEDVALYDGSWSDWGADPETPKAVGDAG